MSPTMVIGIYEDNGQVFVTTVPNPDPHEAMLRVAREALLEAASGVHLIILGAVTNGEDDTLVFTEPAKDYEGNGVFAQTLAGYNDDVSE